MKKLLFLVAALLSASLSYAGLISHTDYTAGSVITAAGQNANENTIVNEFNGNINSANIAAGGVATSNIAAGAVTQPKLANGSLSTPSVATKTSTYTITSSDDLIVSSAPAMNNTFTLTLPAASGLSGKVYVITVGNQNLGGYTKIVGNGSDTIGGATTRILQTPNESVTLVSDGTANWKILNHYCSTGWLTITPSLTAGWGTTSNLTAFYRRVGDNLEMIGTFTTGTVASSLGKIRIPTNTTIDSSKTIGADLTPAGFLWTHFNTSSYIGSSNIMTLVADQSNLDGVFISVAANGGAFAESNVSGAVTTSTNVSFKFTVPVQNWFN